MDCSSPDKWLAVAMCVPADEFRNAICTFRHKPEMLQQFVRERYELLRFQQDEKEKQKRHKRLR
jgi:hypothetical protein